MASLKTIRTFPDLNRWLDAADLRTFGPFRLEKGFERSLIEYLNADDNAYSRQKVFDFST